MARLPLVGRWSDYQLSRLELVFALILLLVLISVFLDRAIIMLAKAERSMVETSVVNMNSALRVYVLQAQMRGDDQALAAMQAANPVSLLAELPDWKMNAGLGSEQMAALLKARMSGKLANYAGEFAADDAGQVASGNWYFDTDERALVYRVRNAEVFRSELDGPARIRYRMELDYDDRTGDGRFTPGVDTVRSVGLKPLNEYRWLF